ncbi:hypothetical protein F4809DRAFT_632364 [Biscogniauxia mediterranea]|nr:hypothetical protein F4809DRAFT_632364 [Biscogniauxia mediterranea]
MSHAYVSLFSNRWLARSPQQLDAHGYHGVYWHSLFHPIVNRIRRWHPSLEDFVTQVHLVPPQRLGMQTTAFLRDMVKRFTGLDL